MRNATAFDDIIGYQFNDSLRRIFFVMKIMVGNVDVTR